MKLFRDLLIAAAAMSSFGSVAGLISIQPESDRLANYEMERVIQKYNGDEITDKIYTDALPGSFQINQLREPGPQLYDSLYSLGSTLTRRIGFSSALPVFSENYQGVRELCSNAGLAPTDCGSYTSFVHSSSAGVAIELHQHSEDLFGLSLYLFSSVYFKGEATDEITKFAFYANTVHLYQSYDKSAAPVWLKNLESISYAELTDFMRQSVHNRVKVHDYYFFENEHSCSQADCAQVVGTSYRRTFIGDAYWQSETVPLPTTASFLLLGFAGLALRRRRLAA